MYYSFGVFFMPFRFLTSSILLAVFSVGVQAQNLQLVVGAPDLDPVRWPGGESPNFAIDQAGQKYLNFAIENTGFLVQPQGANAGDIATSMTFWAANDAIPRDPASYRLFGSSSADLLSPTDYFHEDQISLEIFTEIAFGDLALPDSRNDGGVALLDDLNSQTVTFDNTAAYSNYLVLFPTVKDVANANSMQIAEVQLNYDGSDITSGIFDPFDDINGVALVDLDPPKGDPIGPQAAPTAGNWSVREWAIPSAFGAIDSIDTAIAFTTDERVQGTNFVSDGTSSTINFADPQGAGGGYSVPLPKSAFFGDTDGAEDNFVVRAQGKVIIPSNGDYTFGVDGDDGFRLFVDGEQLSEFAAVTGDAFTLASKNLTAGEHDVELVWFEAAGGAFVELFAASGNKTELDNSFSPIGLAESVFVAARTTATLAGDWNVRTVQVDVAAVDDEGTVIGFNIDSLDAARTAIDLADDDVRVLDSVDTEELTVNYGAGANGRFGDELPFEVAGDDFAVEAKATVVIPEDGDYIFGFGGDDGGRLCLADADFTLLGVRDAAQQTVTGDGECVQWAGNTGNSDTFGTTFMTAGEHEIDVLWWERGGGDWLEVYTGIGTDTTAQLTLQLLGEDATEYDLTIAAGLQLAGELVDTCNPNTMGDVDGSGDVAFADFLILSQNFGQAAADHTTGDIDCSGDVAFADFLILYQNFGKKVCCAESVPEPTGAFMLAFALSLVGMIRRRRA